jgi:hypothetical protein
MSFGFGFGNFRTIGFGGGCCPTLCCPTVATTACCPQRPTSCCELLLANSIANAAKAEQQCQKNIANLNLIIMMLITKIPTPP